MSFLAGAWWVLWHPVQALLLGLFALLWVAAPEVALLFLFIWWASARNQVLVRRVVRGPGFTMRDP